VASERVVKVRLSAQIAEYKKGMADAAAATRAVGTEGEKLAQIEKSMQLVGRTGVAVGAAIGVGLGIAVAKFAEFDQAMSNVLATGDDARESQDALREAALEAGASTVFSATESANAIEELAKAGLGASDILGGALTGSLDLAAAGGLGVARAAEIAATTLQQFQLAGEDATHVADLLAAGAGKAMGDVEDIAQALNQAGLVASQFGISVEETVGTLSAFASAGMLGSDAGTSFRTMLLRLANPTEEVKNLMAGLGIEAYDSQGQFIGLAALAGELESSLSGMTQQQRDTTLAMIFGQDAIRGANILLREGEDGIRQWTRAVDDQGYAAETAATRLDNLKGDIEALQGALDTAFITMGSAADGPLRFFTQSLTEAVDLFNALPEGAQQAVFWVGSVASVATVAGGAFLLAVPHIVEYREAIKLLGTGAQRTSQVLGALGKGAGIGVAVAATITIASNALIDYAREIRGTDEAVAVATTTNRGFLESMEDLGVTTDASAKQVKNALRGLAEGNILGSVGTDIQVLRDALIELDKGMVDLPLTDATAKFRAWGEELGLSKTEMSTMLSELPELRKAIQAHLTASGDAADEQAVLTFALDEGAKIVAAVAEETEIATTNLEDMRTALSDVGSTAMDMGAAMDDALSAVNALGEAAQVEGVALDGTNDASIGLRDSIRDVEQAHRDAADAIIANGGTLEEARAEWGRGREAILLQLEAMGLSRDEAVAWADANLGSASSVEDALISVADAARDIPANPTINLQLMGYSEAYQYLTNVQQLLRNITGNNQIRVSTGQGGQGGLVVGNENGGLYERARLKAFADGGFASGIYPGGAEIHKFAERTLPWEAYISPKPDKRAENYGVWMEAGRRLGFEQSPSQQVSLDGVSITGTLSIGGDGLARIIDGRIVQADAASERVLRQGVRPW
jgi:TP901 family phage tail tape measure protein